MQGIFRFVQGNSKDFPSEGCFHCDARVEVIPGKRGERAGR